MKRAISVILILSMMLVLSPAAFAAGSAGNVDGVSDTYMEDLGYGNLFVQQTADRTVAIIAGKDEHVISISIKYNVSPDDVYQWIIYDYPVDEFSPDSMSFWNGVIKYAEGRTDEAEIVHFIVETVEADMIAPASIQSSAMADLTEDMESIVEPQYTGKFKYQQKIIEGHVYRLYENLEFSIRKLSTISWKSGITLASLITDILSYTVTNPTVALICNVLGVVLDSVYDLIPGGKIRKYECMAMYTRYVTVDGGTRQYSYAYKFRVFDGYEPDDSSTGRAHVIPLSQRTYYGTTEDYYYGGLFEEAYKAYNNIW